MGSQLLCKPFYVVIRAVDVDMRVREKQVQPIEPDPLHFCIGCHFDQLVEVDGWFRVRVFTYNSRPGSIMKFRICIRHRLFLILYGWCGRWIDGIKQLALYIREESARLQIYSCNIQCYSHYLLFIVCTVVKTGPYQITVIL